MLKIGEFSKLAHISIKALRFYESEGILVPASVDKWTGYRLYDSAQLTEAARIVSFRQLDLSIDEIKSIQNGANIYEILTERATALAAERAKIDVRLSIIKSIMEERKMDYQVTEKIIPEQIVYTCETILDKYADLMEWIQQVGQECIQLNPSLKCAEPPYEFCEYLDGEYKETNVKIRHNEAVTFMGKENEHIKFRILPEARVLSVFHKGSYETIRQTYAFLMQYAEKNGYQVAGLARESYIDGIWNKETEEDWLTEIQLPIK